MKNLYNLYILLFITSFFVGCNDMKDWSDPTDNVPPGPISNPVVENFSGGAIITYQLPTDNDLLGVKAMYKFFEDDKERVAFSSAFTDTIRLEGFPSSGERVVKLVTLDKSRNESVPVEVIVNPTKIPVEVISETVTVNETFGGIYVSWTNPLKNDIGIALYVADSTGLMQHNYTYYSNAPDGGYSFRGFDDTEREFRIEVVDKWDNYVVAKDTVLTPLYEEKIVPYDKETGKQLWTKFGHLDGSDVWRGDCNKNLQDNDQVFNIAFDGKNSTIYNTGNRGNYLNFYTLDPNHEGKLMNPLYWILDLGRSCNLSRHYNWPWTLRIVALGSGTPRVFELWATNEEPKSVSEFTDIMESLRYWTGWPDPVNGTDAWKEDWDLIAECVMVPPSGATKGSEVTEEDKDFIQNNGFDFEIKPEFTNKPYRYIRFVIIETWGGKNTMGQNGDWDFYGKELD